MNETDAKRAEDTTDDWRELGIFKTSKKKAVVEARMTWPPIRLPNEHFEGPGGYEGIPAFIEFNSVSSLITRLESEKGKLEVTNPALFAHRFVIFGLRNISEFSNRISVNSANRQRLLEEIEKQATARRPHLLPADVKHFNIALEGARQFCQKK